MKSNKKLLTLLVLLGALSCLVAANEYHHSSDDEDIVTMGMTADEYWARVRGDKFEFSGKIRKYYISADEVVWDYAPEGHNVVNGSEFQGIGLPFVEIGPQRIGTAYVKCLYREYTNAKFEKLKPRTYEQQHLGFLGPAMHAEVGDAMVVVFRNKCKFPASIHLHELYYNKANEGALYNDTTSGEEKQDDGVEPGKTHIYKWVVPERCGPGPMDGSSIMSMYYSHVDVNKDFYSGLVGPMCIVRKGMANPDGTPKDIDRELFYMYSVGQESTSHYIQESWDRFATSPPGTPLPTDGGFNNANSKFAINGWIFGNGHLPTFRKGLNVRWYMLSLGNNDAHTPHWHGNTFLVHGMRMDVISVMPGEIVIADMKADDVGIWLSHCHVGAHLDEGMVNRFRVIKPDQIDWEQGEPPLEDQKKHQHDH